MQLKIYQKHAFCTFYIGGSHLRWTKRLQKEYQRQLQGNEKPSMSKRRRILASLRQLVPKQLRHDPYRLWLDVKYASGTSYTGVVSHVKIDSKHKLSSKQPCFSEPPRFCSHLLLVSGRIRCWNMRIGDPPENSVIFLGQYICSLKKGSDTTSIHSW